MIDRDHVRDYEALCVKDRAPKLGANRNGITDDMRRFFTENPDEELTFADITVKWGITEARAREIVKVLRKEGLIESVHVVRNRSKGIACP